MGKAFKAGAQIETGKTGVSAWLWLNVRPNAAGPLFLPPPMLVPFGDRGAYSMRVKLESLYAILK